MSLPEDRAVFLGRRSYASRRRADAARLLPVVGLLLVCLPALIAPRASMAGTLVFVFAAWTFLILAAAVLSRRLGEDRSGEAE